MKKERKMLGRRPSTSSIKKKKRRYLLTLLLRYLLGISIIFLVFESILNSITTTTIPLSSSSSSSIASIIIDQPSNNNSTSMSSSEIMEITRNNNNNNNSNSNVMILAAGWGTTGTHLFFKATCYLGYTSVHWNLGCFPPWPTKATMSPNEIKPKFHIHSKLMNTVSKLSKCLQQQQQPNNNKKNKNKKSCGNAIEWQKKVNNLIDQLVVQQQDIQAFHDIPYPYFINSFVEASYHRYNQKKPILLFSERDPIEWMKRRIDNGHIESDFMCKFEFSELEQQQQQQPTFISSSNNNRMGKQSSLKETPKPPPPLNLSGGRLDLLGCISHAITKSKSKSILLSSAREEEADANNINNNNNNSSMNNDPSPNNTLLDLNDIFISLKFLIENNNSTTTTTTMDGNGNNDDGIQTMIIKEFTSYQDKIRKYADFSYNLFEQYDKIDGHKKLKKTSVQTLASEIENQVPLLRRRHRNNSKQQQQQQKEPMIHVNLVQGTVLDEQQPIF